MFEFMLWLSDLYVNSLKMWQLENNCLLNFMNSNRPSLCERVSWSDTSVNGFINFGISHPYPSHIFNI